MLNRGGNKKIEHEINIVDTQVEDEIKHDRVLIVDDDPHNVDALKIGLQCATADIAHFRFKDRLDTASNGLEALELIKNNYQEGKTYKLILMDCNMPKMDGYEATRNIRQIIADNQQNQPYIVAISGHVEEHYRQRALEAGMNTIVPKPAKPADIRNAIKHLRF